jgi:hypothetical protein
VKSIAYDSPGSYTCERRALPTELTAHSQYQRKTTDKFTTFQGFFHFFENAQHICAIIEGSTLIKMTSWRLVNKINGPEESYLFLNKLEHSNAVDPIRLNCGN